MKLWLVGVRWSVPIAPVDPPKFLMVARMDRSYRLVMIDSYPTRSSLSSRNHRRPNDCSHVQRCTRLNELLIVIWRLCWGVAASVPPD